MLKLFIVENIDPPGLIGNKKDKKTPNKKINKALFGILLYFIAIEKILIKLRQNSKNPIIPVSASNCKI